MLPAHKYLVLLFLNWTLQTGEYFVTQILSTLIPNCKMGIMTLISQRCKESFAKKPLGKQIILCSEQDLNCVQQDPGSYVEQWEGNSVENLFVN